MFWIGVIWTFTWGILASICQTEFFLHELTYDELNQTYWATSGTLMSVWGFSPPLGALIAGIGIMLYSGVSGPNIWKFGIGIILGFAVGFSVAMLGHYSFLFAIGATFILFFFFDINCLFL